MIEIISHRLFFVRLLEMVRDQKSSFDGVVSDHELVFLHSVLIFNLYDLDISDSTQYVTSKVVFDIELHHQWESLPSLHQTNDQCRGVQVNVADCPRRRDG